MRSSRGFTLIELAIVIVIIGILIALVLKGQDLINNARAKRLINEVRKWEVTLWTCLDRLGTFPGDTTSPPDGLINSDPLSDSCFSNVAQAPTSNSIQLGSYTFFIYPGNDGSRNVLVVCGASNCGNVSGDDTYRYFLENFDLAIDGIISATTGIVRALSSATVSSNVVTAVTLGTAWTSTTRGAVYYFDRKP